MSSSLKEFSSEIYHKNKKLVSSYFQSDLSYYITHVLLSCLLGLAAGLSAVLFHILLEKMRHIFSPVHFSSIFHVSNYFIFLVPVFGSIIIATMTHIFKNTSKEKGVSSVIKSLLVGNGYIPAKRTFFHLVAPILSIGTGAPLGPEGPAAQLGSGVGSIMCRLFKLNKKDVRVYTAAGACAAISAVFNAPIAGVFFGIEVILLNDIKNQALSSLIISSVVADIISRAVLGNEKTFLIPQYDLGPVSNYLFFLLLAVACGVVAVTFSKLNNYFNKLFNEKLKIKNEYLRLLPVALVFGLLLIRYDGMFGIGYDTINGIINNHFPMQILLVYFFIKIIFVPLFLNAGSYGGTFAPGLMLGAITGSLLANFLNTLLNLNLDPTVFALVGMGGVLAGSNSIPLTSIMLVFEITNDYRFILPLMFVSIMSHIVVVYVNKGTIYAKELLEKGIDVSKKSDVDLLSRMKVAELKKTDFISVDYRTSFKKVLDLLLENKYGTIFVISSQNQLKGVVSLKEVRQVLVTNELVDLLIADDITMSVPVVAENETLSTAIKKIEKFDLEIIPVVAEKGSHEVIGIITYQDILSTYNYLLNVWETDYYVENYGRSFK